MNGAVPFNPILLYINISLPAIVPFVKVLLIANT